MNDFNSLALLSCRYEICENWMFPYLCKYFQFIVILQISNSPRISWQKLFVVVIVAKWKWMLAKICHSLRNLSDWIADYPQKNLAVLSDPFVGRDIFNFRRISIKRKTQWSNFTSYFFAINSTIPRVKMYLRSVPKLSAFPLSSALC